MSTTIPTVESMILVEHQVKGIIHHGGILGMIQMGNVEYRPIIVSICQILVINYGGKLIITLKENIIQCVPIYPKFLIALKLHSNKNQYDNISKHFPSNNNNLFTINFLITH